MDISVTPILFPLNYSLLLQQGATQNPHTLISEHNSNVEDLGEVVTVIPAASLLLILFIVGAVGILRRAANTFL